MRACWFALVLLAASAAAAEERAARPYLWRFDGGHGPDIRAAIDKSERLSTTLHLTDPLLVANHLEQRRLPQALGCLDDSTECADPVRAGLDLLGTAGRIDASAKREGDEAWLVTFVVTPAGDLINERLFEGRGESLDAATLDAIVRLENQGTLAVTVDPPDAVLFVNGQPIGRGSGQYTVGGGKHTLRAEADKRVPVEESVIIVAADTTSIDLKLPVAYGTLELLYLPEHAQSHLDDKPLGTGPGQFKVIEGRHKVRLFADGFKDHRQTVRVKRDETTRVDVTLKAVALPLVDKLKAPHPDTSARHFYVRAGLRTMSVGSGDIDMSGGEGPDAFALDSIDSIDGSVDLVGVDGSVGWRGDALTVEALGATVAVGGDPTEATFDRSRIGSVDDLSRLVVRGARIGVRYPRWRFDPYLSAGPMYVFESFEFDRPRQQTASFDRSFFVLGAEGGLRYQTDQNWFMGWSGELSFWPGRRLSLAFQFGAGYAFDLWDL